MKRNFWNKSVKLCLVALVLTFSTLGVFASGGGESSGSSAVIYNAPPQWANWALMLEAIKEDLNIDIPFDNKNSGQSLAQLIAEKQSPVADVVYYGSTFGVRAKEEGVTQAYKPQFFDQVPDYLKDPDGYWITIHFGTLGLFVNKDALDGVPVPQTWKDLLKPEYDGLVGYLDPSSAFVGYVGAVAVNLSLGGSLDDFEPVLEFYESLRNPIIPKQTAYSRVLSGEIPILFDYDFNAYRAKYDDEANVEFVIPQEGTISAPYVVSLVKGSKNEENAKKIIDYLLSDKGQKIWASAYLRPIKQEVIPEDIKQKFNPDSDYERVKAVDYAKMTEVYEGFQKAYLDRIR